MSESRNAFDRWLGAFEARHLATLRFAEVSRALRALSSAYVERRDRLGHGVALDGGGKRAAFALFYGPLHFLTAARIVSQLPDVPRVDTLVDLGCGTGAVGAAIGTALAHTPRVVGIDRHQWAVAEAARTYEHFGLRGQMRREDAGRAPWPTRRTLLVAGWFANELDDDARARLLERLLRAQQHGAAVLVIEPISRRLTRWWGGWTEAVLQRRGRADEWRFPVDLPDLVRRLDRAAGLSHAELTARSLWLPGSRPEPAADHPSASAG
jgi:SAM-dependent methyltransferase